MTCTRIRVPFVLKLGAGLFLGELLVGDFFELDHCDCWIRGIKGGREGEITVGLGELRAAALSRFLEVLRHAAEASGT